MLRRFCIAVAVAACGAAIAVPSASGAFGIARWEALTCKTDASTPGIGNWAANGSPCVETDPPERLYMQAAGHPNFGITAFLLNQTGGAPNLPDGYIEELRTELPEGLGVNPEATPQCTRKQLSEIVTAPPVVTKCATEAAASQVGINYFTTISTGPPVFPSGTAGLEITVPVPVYNLEPEFGEPASAGFNATGKPTILESDLNPVDQHISFTIHDIEAPPASLPVIGSRLVFNGKAGAGYLTMPSNCAGPQVTVLAVRSHEGASDTQPYATPSGAEGCTSVPFKPGIQVSSGPTTDSPEPATVDVTLPYSPNAEALANSHLLTAKVTLPEGAGLNPSSANGLLACSDAQFGKGTNNPVACPAASKVGTVTVRTQSLPEPIGGTVYVGEPRSGDPSSGELYRIFIEVSSPRFGVNVRLVGNVFPNLKTGQLTAVVDQNPQAPFESFQVHLDGGPKGTLTSPPVCGPHTTTTEMTPWSGVADESRPSASFKLTTYPGGGPCPATLGARPFSPAYTAKSDSSKAGAYSPFRVTIARADGQQELKAVDVTLPKGLTGKLAGIPYCTEASLAAAAGNSARAEIAGPSCPAASQIGSAITKVGSGGSPYKVDGKAYLAGPHKGAPLSLAVVTPALAGPYDLGTVVVRVALGVDPSTAQVRAASDAIPDVFGGAKLDVRNVDVDIDRSSFMRNPTSCKGQAVSGTLSGGGSNPASPAAWSSAPFNVAYQATECRRLAFKPRLYTRLYGPTKRAQNPRLRAILEAREGDANLARTALTLPHSLFLDQSHIRTVCTRVQLAARQCPRAAIYGRARARSPLLNGVLRGPVYLVSSNDRLPNLVADLHGQVNIQLRGVISSKRGGLKTVFNNLPDVPVKKFILEMRGGRRSLIVNSTNTCARKQTAVLNIKGQNGKKVKSNRYRLNISGCKKPKRR